MARAGPTTSSPCGQALNLEKLRWGVVNLQRRVLDVEAFAEEPLELEPDAVAIVLRMHQDMSGQRWEPRGDLPDMQVVDVDDVGVVGQRATDLLGIDAGRRRFEE